MKLHSIQLGLIALMIPVLTSCFASKASSSTPKEVEVPLILNTDNVYQRFTELDNGLRFNVSTNILNSEIIDTSELPAKITKALPHYNVTPQLKQFINESISEYTRKLGIPVNTSLQADYTLNINIKASYAGLPEHQLLPLH